MDRAAVEDDLYGQIKLRVQGLAREAKRHVDEIVFTLLAGGFTSTCHDGQYFFDTDHSEANSGTQSNKVDVDITTTTAPTPAEMETAILALTTAILGFKDDQGRPTNASAKRFTIMVPPVFMKSASIALGSNVILEGGQSRNAAIQIVGAVNGFAYDMVVNPRLSWTTKFAMFRNDAVLTPFVKQVEVDTQVSALAEGSEEEFKNKRHLYGVNRIMNFGCGDWKGSCMANFI